MKGIFIGRSRNRTTEQTRLVQDITESLVIPGEVSAQLLTTATSQVSNILPPFQKRTIDATRVRQEDSTSLVG